MTPQAHRSQLDDRHYLERELEELVRDNRIWHFIRAGSLDGIWYRDLERPDHEWMSPELWGLLGVDPVRKGHSPKAWQDFIDPDDLELATRNLKAHCTDPSHPYDQVVRCRHADGSTVWVRWRGLAIRDRTGHPIRMLGAYNDVTALKRAEEEANRARGVATHANEDLQTFAYSTSHDLKSPANTIRMLLQEARLALRNGDPADAETLLSRAETTNEGMRNMLDKLLEYTCVAGTIAPPAPVLLDSLVAEVLEDLGADIARTGAQINVDPLGTVLGVEWQLRRMFQNFIANAIKFQPEGNVPQIDIRARPTPGSRATIEIADNGIGIAPADQTRIFELFARLHRGTSFQGAGVGLAICSRIARAHGSTINVSSTPAGTTFSFDLPI